jgi:3-oxoisoapionate decarboxylase
MDRRRFLASAGVAAAAAAAATVAAPRAQANAQRRLGIDVFSIRSQAWTPFEYMDYCAKQKVDVVFFSEPRFLGSLEEANLVKIRDAAKRSGLGIEVGMRSICPSARSFDPKAGTAEEQIATMVRVAKTLGSPVVRCFQGTMEDRRGPVPFAKHMENTIQVLRNVRSRVMDAGLMMAVENHAGDLQAHQLRTIIETAGKEFVGACIDPGNSTWALEDPHRTLDLLAPYSVASGVRDSAVWRAENGIAVQWVRMGEGNVEIQRWCERFWELCPGRTLSLEVICIPSRVFPVFQPSFWEHYEDVPASVFAGFLKVAEKGTARPPDPKLTKEEQLVKEREDLEASVKYCQQVLRA